MLCCTPHPDCWLLIVAVYPGLRALQLLALAGHASEPDRTEQLQGKGVGTLHPNFPLTLDFYVALPHGQVCRRQRAKGGP